jgi:hypothetical protein
MIKTLLGMLSAQDWLRWSTLIDIEENIEELTMLEKGISFLFLFHHYSMVHCISKNINQAMLHLSAELKEEFGAKGKRKQEATT